jgi:hypothetical protein
MAVLATLMMLRFAKTVEDLGLLGKKGRLLVKRQSNFDNRFRRAVEL